MIFMSQSAIVDASREAQWDQWYLEHLQVMLTVPGVASAQRFKTSSQTYPRSLALYTFSSADIFKDAYYLGIRGQGEWVPLIDKRSHHRNLFAGMQAAPDVGSDACLLVVDRAVPSSDSGPGFTWLEAVAVDRSTPYRGIAVVALTGAKSIAPDDGAIYRPVTARLTPR